MKGHFWNLHGQVMSSCLKSVAHDQKPPAPSMPRHPGLIPSCRRPAAPMEHFLPSRGSAQPTLLHTPGFWVLQRRTTPADATDCRVSDSQLSSCWVWILFFGDSFNSKSTIPGG